MEIEDEENCKFFPELWNLLSKPKDLGLIDTAFALIDSSLKNTTLEMRSIISKKRISELKVPVDRKLLGDLRRTCTYLNNSIIKYDLAHIIPINESNPLELPSREYVISILSRREYDRIFTLNETIKDILMGDLCSILSGDKGLGGDDDWMGELQLCTRKIDHLLTFIESWTIILRDMIDKERNPPTVIGYILEVEDIHHEVHNVHLPLDTPFFDRMGVDISFVKEKRVQQPIKIEVPEDVYQVFVDENRAMGIAGASPHVKAIVLYLE